MRQGYERFRQCRDKKPGAQMRREMRMLKKYWRCYPLHYYRYDLYRRDRQLSHQDLLDYIPEFVFYDLFLPCFDDFKYQVLLEDKITTEQFFRSLAIKQPHTICKLIQGNLYHIDLQKKSFLEVETELKEKQHNKIFIKPTDGRGGYGIVIFTRNSGGKYVNPDGRVFGSDYLEEISRENDFLIQAGLEQHPAISSIYPHSVNTFRIATENRRGRVRLLCSTMRIGRHGNQVDNSAQDGIIVKIDLASGRAAPYATSEQNEYFERHPDTGYAFEDFSVPDWDEVKRFCGSCAEKLAQFTYLGWDIALSRSGPMAIETNLNFAIDHYQVVLGGMRELFNIEDPKWFWKNSGKRIF